MPTAPITSVTQAPRRCTFATISRRRSTASRSTPTTKVRAASPSSLTGQESHTIRAYEMRRPAQVQA